MIVLALLSVVMVFVEIIGNINPGQEQIIQSVDLTIALIFLGDFIYNWKNSKDKKVFLHKYWWELLAAIPITTTTTQALRVLKIAEIFPLIEMFRFARLFIRLRMIIFESEKFTKQAVLIYIMISLAILIFSGALGFYHFEKGVNPNVHSFFDSFYWAAITTATVGYGDIYPITVGGKIVSIFLIFSGVAAIGAFITVAQSYIIKNLNTKQ